jgi:hypothetical protein
MGPDIMPVHRPPTDYRAEKIELLRGASTGDAIEEPLESMS